MEINSKDELLSVIEDLQSRLAVIEDAGKKPEPKGDDEPKSEKTESESTEEVESEDEIEKLLNV